MKPPATNEDAPGAPLPPSTPPLTSQLMVRAAGASLLVMASYYGLRPLRDELSTEYRDATADWWVWVGVIAVFLMPLYSTLISRTRQSGVTRRVFRVIAVVILGFAAVNFQQGNAAEGFGPKFAGSFYVVASLYPMLVVSVLWSTLTGCFDARGGRTRIGPVFAAGTVGAALGSGWVSLTAGADAWLIEIAPGVQLLISAGLLLLSSFVVPEGATPAGGGRADGRIAERLSSGLGRLVRSPYLLGIAGYLLLFTMGSGFLYFLQRELIYEAYPDRGDRRAVLANLDLSVQILAFVGQAVVTGALLKRIGTARVLLIMPVITVAGFVLLAASPIFAVFAGLIVLRRASNYAFSKPARELLFTVVDAEERYLTKPTLDVAVYRGGDVLAAKTYEAIQGPDSPEPAGTAEMAAWAVPFAVAALPLAYWLGRQQEARANAERSPQPEAEASAE